MSIHDVNQPAAGPAALPPVPAIGSVHEFDQLLGEVQKAAHEWGLRPSSNESRFVSALLGSTRWMGRLIESFQAAQQKLFDQNRMAAELELARAREITKAVNVTLTQARGALISLQIERENVVVRMLQETMPMFAERLKTALVIREKAVADGLRLRRFCLAGLFAVGVFTGGYGLCWWQDSGTTHSFRECLAHPLQAGSHFYCNVTQLLSSP